MRWSAGCVPISCCLRYDDESSGASPRTHSAEENEHSMYIWLPQPSSVFHSLLSAIFRLLCVVISSALHRYERQSRTENSQDNKYGFRSLNSTHRQTYKLTHHMHPTYRFTHSHVDLWYTALLVSSAAVQAEHMFTHSII